MTESIPKKTIEQRRAVGRIIFADLLESPLKKYRGFIQATEESLPFKKLKIQFKRLSRNKTGDEIKKTFPMAIAEIVKKGEGFSIRYTYAGFNKLFLVSKLFCQKSNMDSQSISILFRLRRINSRNGLTFSIIEEILEHQKKFLTTGNPSDLLLFSQVQLAERLSEVQLSKVDIGWISRLVRKISVITPFGEKRPLKSFFPSQKDINRRLIERLLDKENEAIKSGRSKKALTAKQIGVKLKSKYGVTLSRHSIYNYLEEMGIPSARKRFSGYKYPPLSVNFSPLYPLTGVSVQNNAPAGPGVYEFRLNGKGVRYPKGKISVIYIGSTKDIKKRLKAHLGTTNKNTHLRNCLDKFGCYFRYIRFTKEWYKEEERLYKLFVSTYGAPPKCNCLRPPKIKAIDLELNRKKAGKDRK